uniref:Retrotransposon Copia-like N-terminal domain-containing protein n=1 Tax=Quercus lobata TaxID=97700 RepID=A0A7N2LKF0_QUELO
MKMALNAKNKPGFIDGSITKPTESQSDAQLWDCCNDMVLSWILNSIDKNLVASLIFHDSAQTVWLDLEAHFSQNPLPFVSKVYSILHQEEKQRRLHLPTPNSDAIVMFVNSNFCSNFFTESKGRGRGRPKCGRFGALGHWKDTRYNAIPGLSAKQYRQLMDFLSSTNSTSANFTGNLASCNLVSSPNNSECVIDTGDGIYISVECVEHKEVARPKYARAVELD